MPRTPAKRIGILTGGGDCPGLNAVIPAAAKSAWNQYGATVIGIRDGFEGVVEGQMHDIERAETSNIVILGGTILGSSDKGDPWHYPAERVDVSVEIQDMSYEAIRNPKRRSLDALIAIGGDGTMSICSKLQDNAIDIVGVPKNIDNDLASTDRTLGIDTAISLVCEAIDGLYTTASSHQCATVIEVMGRHAGWIALAGVAGGADAILLPEIPFTSDAVFKVVNERNTHDKRCSIIGVAEVARLPGDDHVVKSTDAKRTDERQLVGMGDAVARAIVEGVGLETSVTVLGHLRRGGSPPAFDCVLATNCGKPAAHLACCCEFGAMVAKRNNQVVPVRIKDAIATLRAVPRDEDLVLSARSVGVSCGDWAAPRSPARSSMTRTRFS